MMMYRYNFRVRHDEEWGDDVVDMKCLGCDYEEEMDLERQRTRRERDLAARKERTARRLREKEEPELIKDPSLGDRKRGRAR